jgi:predicted N-formylglutamate amidohydrolase
MTAEAAGAEAVEVVPGARAGAALVVTCEHATERLPAPWRWPEADRWLLGTHWASDIGAADLARAIAAETGGSLVLARFTRLLVDPNRAEDHPALVLVQAEGRPIALNASLSPEERARRLALHRAYHDAVDGAVARSAAPIVLAVHTFTPVYEGRRRDVELGLLFDRDEALARAIADELAPLGLRTALNEPYSGRAGLIYSADRHARRHGRRALEIELRQDLASRSAVRARLAPALSTAVATVLRRFAAE